MDDLLTSMEKSENTLCSAYCQVHISNDAEWDFPALTLCYLPNTHYELCTYTYVKYPEKIASD